MIVRHRPPVKKLGPGLRRGDGQGGTGQSSVIFGIVRTSQIAEIAVTVHSIADNLKLTIINDNLTVANAVPQL